MTAEELRKLADEIERLTARVAELEKDLDDQTCGCGDGFSGTSMCANCVAAMLKADNDEVTDAKRYRWLRSSCSNPAYAAVSTQYGPRMIMREHLDAAIDAAIASEATT